MMVRRLQGRALMKTLPELNSGLTDEGLSAEPMPELNSGGTSLYSESRTRNAALAYCYDMTT